MDTRILTTSFCTRLCRVRALKGLADSDSPNSHSFRFILLPAASCEHPEVIKLLLARGANRSIKDTEDLLAEETTTNDDILKLFKTTG
jgi:hypothetical protein